MDGRTAVEREVLLVFRVRTDLPLKKLRDHNEVASISFFNGSGVSFDHITQINQAFAFPVTHGKDADKSTDRELSQ